MVYVVLHYRLIVGVYDAAELAEAGKAEWIKRYPSDRDSVTVHLVALNTTWVPK